MRFASPALLLDTRSLDCLDLTCNRPVRCKEAKGRWAEVETVSQGGYRACLRHEVLVTCCSPLHHAVPCCCSRDTLVLPQVTRQPRPLVDTSSVVALHPVSLPSQTTSTNNLCIEDSAPFKQTPPSNPAEYTATRPPLLYHHHKQTNMTRIYSISIPDNSTPAILLNTKAAHTNSPKALSLRSSSTASMLPKPRRVAIATRSSGWDTPRISPQQRLVMQRFDKQAKHGKMMQRLFGHRLVPGFLR